MDDFKLTEGLNSHRFHPSSPFLSSNTLASSSFYLESLENEEYIYILPSLEFQWDNRSDSSASVTEDVADLKAISHGKQNINRDSEKDIVKNKKITSVTLIEPESTKEAIKLDTEIEAVKTIETEDDLDDIGDVADTANDSDSSSDYGEVEALDLGVTLDEDSLTSQIHSVQKPVEEKKEADNFTILKTEVEFFKQFPADMQRNLFNELKEKQFNDGEYIVKQGEKGDSFFIVVRGKVTITRQKETEIFHEDGTSVKRLIDIHITDLGVGSSFGERALLYGKERDASVVSKGNSTCLVLSKAGMKRYPQISTFLFVIRAPILLRVGKDTQFGIFSLLEQENYKKDDVIFREGSRGRVIYLIIKGSVKVTEKGEHLTTLRMGHIFGMLSFASDNVRSATVKALEEVLVYALPHEAYLTLSSKMKDEFSTQLQKEIDKVSNVRIKRGVEAKRRNSQMGLAAQNSVSSLDIHSGVHSPLSFGTDIPPLDTPSSVVVRETRLRRSTVRGRDLINDYEILELLGKGSFGTAHKCKNRISNEYAVLKTVNKSCFISKAGISSKYQKKLNDLYLEVDIMEGLEHRNVVRLLGVINDENASNLYIITEYCEKRGIFDTSTKDAIHEPLSEDTARKYIRDVLCGLDYLHYNQIAHRDIKPMNLFVTSEDIVKIGDFGTACKFSSVNCREKEIQDRERHLADVAGTPAFMAPELLSEDNDFYDPAAVDMWSLGATLYMFITGYPPWDSEDEIELANKVKFHELEFPSNWDVRGFTIHLKYLLTALLVRDVSKRMTLAQAFKNEWITEEGVQPMYSEFSGISPRRVPIRKGNIFQKRKLSVHEKSFTFGQEISPGRRRMTSPFKKRKPAESDVRSSAVSSVNHSQSFHLSNSFKYSKNTSHIHENIHLSDLEVLKSPRAGSVSSTGSHRTDRSLLSKFPSLNSRFSKSCRNIKLDHYGGDLFLQYLQASRNQNEKGVTLDDVAKVDGCFAHENNGIDYVQNRRNSSTPRTPTSKYSRRTSTLHAVLTQKGGRFVRASNVWYACSMTKGGRPRQEDRISVIENLNLKDDASQPVFFGAIFDGFGGDTVSNYIAQKLPKYIAKDRSFPSDIRTAVKSAVFSVNKRYLKKAAKNVLKDMNTNREEFKYKSFMRTRHGMQSSILQFQQAGSTGVFCMIENVEHRRFLHYSWLGDSRLLISRNGRCISLTRDHKSGRHDETDRIRKAGGQVNHQGRLNGTIIVSRGFGALAVVGKAVDDLKRQCESVLKLIEAVEGKADNNAKKQLINGPFCFDPEIGCMEINPGDEFVLLASDGLFEKEGSEAVMKEVRNLLKAGENPHSCITKVVQKFSCRDNTTALLILLYPDKNKRKISIPLPKSN